MLRQIEAQKTKIRMWRYVAIGGDVMPICMPKRVPRFGSLAYKLYANALLYAKVYAKLAPRAKEAVLSQCIVGGIQKGELVQWVHVG